MNAEQIFAELIEAGKGKLRAIGASGIVSDLPRAMAIARYVEVLIFAQNNYLNTRIACNAIRRYGPNHKGQDALLINVLPDPFDDPFFGDARARAMATRETKECACRPCDTPTMSYCRKCGGIAY